MAEGESNAVVSPGGAQPESEELENIGSQSAYDAFVSAARALEPGFIEECCADIPLAYFNVVRGVDSVLGTGSVVVGKLPDVNVVELSMLPRLAQGLAFAALQVEREQKASSFGGLFERAQQLRRKLRKAADALAEANLLPAADIDEVWLHAQQDVLGDALSLIALLRRNEAGIAGRSPVTTSELLEAEQFITRLRAMLGQSDDVRAGATPALLKALEMRDRFWTLLSQRHDVLWRCGVWLFGRAADERVPPLPVRRARVQRTSAVPVPQEAPRSAPEPVPTAAPVAPVSSLARPAPGGPPKETTRHLDQIQRDLERKTRFLVRIGVIAPQR